MAVKRKTTKLRIADIAAAAGVSIATASNVLARRKQYTSEAGLRVLRVAKEMGYKIKDPAELRKCIRFIIYKKHGQIVMDTPFFAELIGGIEQACRMQKYELLISYVDASKDPNYKTQVQNLVRDSNMPILLLATEMNEDDLEPFLPIKMPLLVLDSPFRWPSLEIVVMNNQDAGRQAAEHLFERGHRHVGYIGSSLSIYNMDDRFLGFSGTLREKGVDIKLEDKLLVEPTMEGAYLSMQKLLEKRKAPVPTAFFAANDIIAAGASRAFKAAGFRLPHDISMVGMDDMPFCQILNPALTTIAVPKRPIGETAVMRLIEMVKHPDTISRKTFIGVTLIARDSVATVQNT